MKRTIAALVAFSALLDAYSVQVNASVQPARCGLNNGSAWAYASGGLPPYSYSWNNGVNGQSNPDLAPGEYIVTVTDGLSNTDQDTVVVEAVWELANAYYESQAACGGGCGGHVIVDLGQLGGTAPYSYSLAPPWIMENGGQAEVFGVCTDVPTDLTITDANGCSVDLELIANTVWPYQHSVENYTPECEGEQNGTITMQGAWGYVAYQVSNNGGFSEIFEFNEGPYIITGLAAGDYDIQPMVPDGFGGFQYPYCEFGDYVTIPSITPPCGSVSGRLFNDADQDCIQDALDIGLPYRVLTIEPGPYYAISDASGDYVTALPNGSFTIAQPLVNESQLCPDEVPVPFDVDFVTPNVVIDFADSSLVQHDLSVHLWQHQQARPGFSFHMHGHLRNHSAYPGGPVTVTMTYDPVITPTSISPAPSSVVVGTITWDLAQVVAYQHTEFTVRFSVPADITLLGTLLDFTFSENNVAFETDDLNNIASLQTTIVGAYDPNDKTARTSSNLSGTQYFLDEDAYIDYTIRFQNTGTAFAQNVVVRDSLELDLDPATLEIIGASHAFVPSFENGRTLVFTFENINLPDSGFNEPNSHGSIHFRIRPREDITVGEVISNAVGIYFDFNPPVITNTSELLVEMSTEVQGQGQDQHLRVFPMPAVDELRIMSSEPIQQVQVLGIDGRAISMWPFRGGSVDVSALAPGSYFLRVILQDGQQRTVRFEKR